MSKNDDLSGYACGECHQIITKRKGKKATGHKPNCSKAGK